MLPAVSIATIKKSWTKFVCGSGEDGFLFLIVTGQLCQCFDVVWAPGMVSSSATTIPISLLLGTSLTWNNLIWNYSGRIG